MERIVRILEEIQKVNNAYNLSSDTIDKICSEMAGMKVCTPVIGKFSSGKSALINTVLGYSRKILKEDITPETAIPTEIVYSASKDEVTIIDNNGSCETLDLNEFRGFEADASTVKCARIYLRNKVLQQIQDVMIVDMPGFESGFEIHNKAIDEYLPRSLAYIVTFPADDMIVRSSVGNILKELCLNDMPLCVVITKYDKHNDDFEITFEKMKENLKRFIGEREVYYCITSSRDGDAQDLIAFLQDIQNHSQQILEKYFTAPTLNILANTENYLKTMLTNSKLSESELNEQEDRLHKQFETLTSKFAKEQENFNTETQACIEEIKGDVQSVLESEESTLVAMIMNGQEIKEHLNNLIRNTVTKSIKERFSPKVEKYLKKVANCINSESIGSVNIAFCYDMEKINKGMTSSIVAVVAGVLLGIPILGIVAAIIMKVCGDKKREEAKRNIRMKLQSEVFPQVLSQVGNGIEQAITEQVKLVNTSIEEEVNNQKVTLDKAMADVRAKLDDEKSKKENLAVDIKADLDKINELRECLQ